MLQQSQTIREEMGIPDKKLKEFTPEECRRYHYIKTKRLRANNPGRQAAYARKAYQANPDKLKAAARKFRDENPLKVKELTRISRLKHRDRCLAATKKWRLENQEHIREYTKKYLSLPEVKQRTSRVNSARRKRLLRERPGYRIINAQRGRLHELLTSGKTNYRSKTLRLDAQTVREHLERKFEAGMTWENYGCDWVCDHIIPVAEFDLRVEAELLKCFSVFNLQPMWKKANRDKWDKVLTQSELLLGPIT